MSDALVPAPIAIAQADLDDLHDRLARTRWPDAETVWDGSQGVPLRLLRLLCDHWRDHYDWRKCEALLNGWNPQRTVIGGLGIEFFQVRSPEPGALPVIMTHSWPGSVLEFARVVGPLTDPRAHGGDPADALTLVLPSLPGHGFSDKPTGPGWGVERIARAWETLMRRLGHGHRWAAQGGDWGGEITLRIAAAAPRGLVGCHLSSGPVPVSDDDADDDFGHAIMTRRRRYAENEFGYAMLQSTRPQTVGYALSDSPAGQAAWIYEKLTDWVDGDPETVLGLDAVLDTISLYWLSGSAASSARLYWESLRKLQAKFVVEVPAGFSMFPVDPAAAPRRSVDRVFRNVARWSEPESGGHFGAWEQPARFIEDVRATFTQIR